MSNAQEALELRLGSDTQGRNACVAYLALHWPKDPDSCMFWRYNSQIAKLLSDLANFPQKNHSPACRMKQKEQHFYKSLLFLECQMRLQASVWELSYTYICTREMHPLTFPKSSTKCLVCPEGTSPLCFADFTRTVHNATHCSQEKPQHNCLSISWLKTSLDTSTNFIISSDITPNNNCSLVFQLSLVQFHQVLSRKH